MVSSSANGQQRKYTAEPWQGVNRKLAFLLFFVGVFYSCVVYFYSDAGMTEPGEAALETHPRSYYNKIPARPNPAITSAAASPSSAAASAAPAALNGTTMSTASTEVTPEAITPLSNALNSEFHSSKSKNISSGSPSSISTSSSNESSSSSPKSQRSHLLRFCTEAKLKLIVVPREALEEEEEEATDAVDDTLLIFENQAEALEEATRKWTRELERMERRRKRRTGKSITGEIGTNNTIVSGWKVERIAGPDFRTANNEGFLPNKANLLYGLRFGFSDGSFLFVSIAFDRGKRDDVDDGYLWIPSFGGKRVAKAFSKFQTVREERSQFWVPKNKTNFLWENQAARFLECNFDNVREFHKNYGNEEKSEYSSKTFMKSLVHIRKVFASWGLFNWLWSGSLLGWWRECAIIAHTTDADTALFAGGYREWMKDYFVNKDKVLRLHRKYGHALDSLEFTLIGGDAQRIDVFFLYEDENPPPNDAVPSGVGVKYLWNGVQTFINYKKGHSLYPFFTRVCSADLLGYRVYVPCDPASLIKAEYGANEWKAPKENWHWITSPFNVVVEGKWKAEEWEGGAVYEKFDRRKRKRRSGRSMLRTLSREKKEINVMRKRIL